MSHIAVGRFPGLTYRVGGGRSLHPMGRVGSTLQGGSRTCRTPRFRAHGAWKQVDSLKGKSEPWKDKQQKSNTYMFFRPAFKVLIAYSGETLGAHTPTLLGATTLSRLIHSSIRPDHRGTDAGGGARSLPTARRIRASRDPWVDPFPFGFWTHQMTWLYWNGNGVAETDERTWKDTLTETHLRSWWKGVEWRGGMFRSCFRAPKPDRRWEFAHCL